MAALPFGFYFTGKDARYPDGFHETAFTTLWRTNIYTTEDPEPGEPRPYSSKQAIDIRRAAHAGKGLVLALEIGFSRNVPAKKTIAQAKPYWNQVHCIELADEPDWDKGEAEFELNRIRSLINAAGLDPVPLGVTLTVPQALGNASILKTSCDYFGVEGYLDPRYEPESPMVARHDVREVLERQLAVLPAKRPVLFIAQCYTFTGAWSDSTIPSLVAMQEETYAVARETVATRPVLGIMAFAYSRPSGARTHPELKQVWKRLINGGV